MKITELKNQLHTNPDANVRFRLPGGDLVPAHAHVTEVARIDKRFVDCGGTLRSESLCRLQTWSADDVDHRLTAGKLVKILEKGALVLQSDDLDVDIEHELGVISQFPLDSIERTANELILHLSTRHTDCLAKDQCKPKSSPKAEFDPLRFNFRETPASASCCNQNNQTTH